MEEETVLPIGRMEGKQKSMSGRKKANLYFDAQGNVYKISIMFRKSNYASYGL